MIPRYGFSRVSGLVATKFMALVKLYVAANGPAGNVRLLVKVLEGSSERKKQPGQAARAQEAEQRNLLNQSCISGNRWLVS